MLCLSVCMYVYTYVCMYVCMYVYIYIYIYIRTSTYIHTCIHAYIRMIHTYIHHAYIQIYMHIYIYNLIWCTWFHDAVYNSRDATSILYHCVTTAKLLLQNDYYTQHTYHCYTTALLLPNSTPQYKSRDAITMSSSSSTHAAYASQGKKPRPPSSEHTSAYVSIRKHFVSSYYYIRLHSGRGKVLRTHICPHTTVYVSSYILLYMCPENLSATTMQLQRSRCVCVCVCVCVRERERERENVCVWSIYAYRPRDRYALAAQHRCHLKKRLSHIRFGGGPGCQKTFFEGGKSHLQTAERPPLERAPQRTLPRHHRTWAPQAFFFEFFLNFF